MSLFNKDLSHIDRGTCSRQERGFRTRRTNVLSGKTRGRPYVGLHPGVVPVREKPPVGVDDALS